MDKTKRTRTRVKELPRRQKELTAEEQKGVRGGLLVTGDVEQEHPHEPSGTTTRPDQPASGGNGGTVPIQPNTGQTPRATR